MVTGEDMKEENGKKVFNTGIEKNAYYWEKNPVLAFGENDFSINRPKLVDLFSGCGGISAGFEMAGFETVFANDIHPPSIETISRNHPNANTIIGDIRKIRDKM